MEKTCTGCVVSAGTHKPAEALHQIDEKNSTLIADAKRLGFVADQIRALSPEGSEEDIYLTEASEVFEKCAERIAELEAKLEAIGAGGVEPLRKPAAPQAVHDAVPTDDELTQAWIAAGGDFFGPNTPTGSMPESKLFPFLRQLAATQPAAQVVEKDAERYRMIRDRAEFLDNAKHCIFERDGWEIHGLLHGNDLDMAIDAALAAQAKQGEK